jgi:NitT/TauT family transport system substrate-binding protein
MRDHREEHVHLLTRRQVLRGAAGLGLAAATGTLLPACSSGGGGGRHASVPEPDGPPETTSIRLHSAPPISCFAAIYMAEPFLREEGFTDVQYPRYRPGAVIDSFASGDIDFGVVYGAALMPKVEAGAPVVMLGGMHVGCWQVFATGDIKSLRDFKGKRVAISSLTETDGIFMTMILGDVGLDVRQDVRLVNHPPTENARILASGEVDAVTAFPPISKDLKAKGIGTVVLDSMTDPPWSNYFCCVPAANRDWMDKHPVAAKRALRALLKGADVVARDPDGTARHIVDRGYTTNLQYTTEALREIPYDVWREFDPLDSMRFYALRLKDAGIIKSSPEQIIKDGTDFRYFSQLKQELKQS